MRYEALPAYFPCPAWEICGVSTFTGQAKPSSSYSLIAALINTGLGTTPFGGKQLDESGIRVALLKLKADRSPEEVASYLYIPPCIAVKSPQHPTSRFLQGFYGLSKTTFSIMSNQEPTSQAGELEQDVEPGNPHGNRLKDFYANPWTQIVLISVICFCCPGVISPSTFRFHFR